MFHRKASPEWAIGPEAATVHLRVDHPFAVLGCYELLDQLRVYLANVEVVVLEGAGWSTPRMWKTARVVNELATTHGAEVRVEAPALMSVVKV